MENTERLVQEQSGEKLQNTIRVIKNIINKFGIFLVLFAVCLAIALMTDKFLTWSNIINVTRQTTTNAIMAIGISFVIITGGIDLSVGSVLAFSSAVACKMILEGTSAAVAIPSGMLIGMVIGLFSGVLVSKVKIAPFIATLATMTIFRGFTLVFTGGMPMSGMDESFTQIGTGYVFGFLPVPVIILIVIALIAWFVQRKTKFGRYIYAIGGNESAAKLSGIMVGRVKVAVYAISGLLCAIAGLIMSARLNSAQPRAGEGAELDAIAAAVIGGVSLDGGKGTIRGVIAGAFIIGVLNNALNLLNVSPYYQQAVKGIVILIAVIIDRVTRKKEG